MIFEPDEETQRLKWVFSSCKNGAWGADADGETDVVCIRAADFDGRLGRLNDRERTLRSVDQDTYEKLALRPGDIIIEKSGGGEKQLVGRASIYDGNEPSITSNFLARCRPASGMEPAFVNYLLLAIYNGRGTFPHLKQSTGIQNLDLASFLNIRVRIPTLDTQRRIARFLDEKTARIDGLIEKKRALLDRLAEKRQALITRAVTKGLDPDTPMMPSGIDWLGDIPAHWEVKRLRFLLNGGTLNGLYKTKEEFDPEGIPFVQMGEAFRSPVFGGGTEDCVSASKDEVEKWGLLNGDFLIARRSIVFEGSGKSVLVSGLEVPHLFESSMIRIRPLSPQEHSEYLSFYFQSHIGRETILSVTKRVTISGIDSQQLKSIHVPVPPNSEARIIAAVCEVCHRSIQSIEREVSASIEKLAEYRSALITAAVTGQLAELR